MSVRRIRVSWVLRLARLIEGDCLFRATEHFLLSVKEFVDEIFLKQI
jgi:hypothetical protein